MFWDVYMGEHAAGGGFSFLIGFVAAIMLFAALAWHGLRTEPDAPKSSPAQDLRHDADNGAASRESGRASRLRRGAG